MADNYVAKAMGSFIYDIPRVKVGPPTVKEWDDCILQGGSGEPGSYVLAKPVVDIPPGASGRMIVAMDG